MPAYYASFVRDFVSEDPRNVFSALIHADEGFSSIWRTAITVWEAEIPFLQKVLGELATQYQSEDWGVVLEFPIPRRQKRIDAVLISAGCIFVIEFKMSDVGTHLRKLRITLSTWMPFTQDRPTRLLSRLSLRSLHASCFPSEFKVLPYLLRARCDRDQLATYLNHRIELFAGTNEISIGVSGPLQLTDQCHRSSTPLARSLLEWKFGRLLIRKAAPKTLLQP